MQEIGIVLCVSLNAVLEVAWKCLFHTAKVVADYTPEEFNLLPIARGQHLIIISKEGDATGWWKGRFGDQVRRVRENLLNSWLIK